MKNIAYLIIILFLTTTLIQCTLVDTQSTPCSQSCNSMSYLSQNSITIQYENIKLTAMLTNNNKTLTLIILDLQNGIVYGKQYKQTDIGTTINKNFQLTIIYQSIARIYGFIQADNYNKTTNNMPITIHKYTYNTVLKYNNISYFKVEDKGVLTVYRSIFQYNTNKTKVYQSKIQLPKVRKMSIYEIYREKYVRDQLQRDKDIGEDIQLLKEKNQNLTIQITSLKNKISNGTIKVNNTTTNNNTSNSQINTVINQLKNELNKLKKKQPYYGQANDWKPVPGLRGVMLQISYASLNLTKTPKIFTSLAGDRIWTLTGINAIYNASPKGFEVYIYGKNITQIKQAGTDAVLHYQIVPQEDA